MLRFQVITLFPEFVDQLQTLGLMRRAVAEGLVSISSTQLRDFAINNHGQVDDTSYGGGPGMVLRPEPGVAAIEAAKKKDPQAKVICFTPRGKKLTHKLAQEVASSSLTNDSGLILLCSRYEGVDERVLEGWVDEEISIGDFVLMGGELPALTFIETITRLIPGVLGNQESALSESFTDDLLEHSHYTKPAVFRNKEVPSVLLSGNHREVEKWRKLTAQEITLKRRPDLLEHSPRPTAPLCVALIHHPVVDKQGDIITSSLTNLDIHDIARSSRTYGVNCYYIVHPILIMRKLAERVCSHWVDGFGLHYNPNRSEALDIVRVVPDLDDVLLNIESRFQKSAVIITTSAKASANSIGFAEMRARLKLSDAPHLLLLGTGWGLSPDILARAAYHLEPINGPTPYNHLSVRAAAAILLDRLLAPR